MTTTPARAAIDPDLAAEVRFRLVEMAVAKGHPLELCVDFARQAAEFVIGPAPAPATFTDRLAEAHTDLKKGRIEFGRIEPDGETASTDTEAQHVEETTHKPGGGDSNGEAAEAPPSSTPVEAGLTPNEQRVLDALIGLLDGGEGSPKQSEIASVAGVSLGSIPYVVGALVKKGRLHSEHKDGKRFYRLLEGDRLRAQPPTEEPRKPARKQTDAERERAIEAQRRNKAAPAATKPGHRICRNADCGAEFKPARPTDLVCPRCVDRYAGAPKQPGTAAGRGWS